MHDTDVAIFGICFVALCVRASTVLRKGEALTWPVVAGTLYCVLARRPCCVRGKLLRGRSSPESNASVRILFASFSLYTCLIISVHIFKNDFQFKVCPYIDLLIDCMHVCI